MNLEFMHVLSDWNRSENFVIAYVVLSNKVGVSNDYLLYLVYLQRLHRLVLVMKKNGSHRFCNTITVLTCSRNWTLSQCQTFMTWSEKWGDWRFTPPWIWNQGIGWWVFPQKHVYWTTEMSHYKMSESGNRTTTTIHGRQMLNSPGTVQVLVIDQL